VHRTPKNAILANLALSLSVGLGVGFGLNASRSYLLTNGLVLVLAVLYIYVSANFAVAFYYLRFRRDEFNPILHIGFPRPGASRRGSRGGARRAGAGRPRPPEPARR
jgi:amino acid transporter